MVKTRVHCLVDCSNVGFTVRLNILWCFVTVV